MLYMSNAESNPIILVNYSAVLYVSSMKSTCSIPGCDYISETLLEFENHYNASHRYTCARCKKVLPSPHLLDLHVQENHDSFFAVLSERKPSVREV